MTAEACPNYCFCSIKVQPRLRGWERITVCMEHSTYSEEWLIIVAVNGDTFRNDNADAFFSLDSTQTLAEPQVRSRQSSLTAISYPPHNHSDSESPGLRAGSDTPEAYGNNVPVISPLRLPSTPNEVTFAAMLCPQQAIGAISSAASPQQTAKSMVAGLNGFHQYGGGVETAPSMVSTPSTPGMLRTRDSQTSASTPRSTPGSQFPVQLHHPVNNLESLVAADQSLPPSPNPADQPDSVVASASQRILREDYMQFLEESLPRWERDGLWGPTERLLQPANPTSAFRELQLAYSSVCQLDVRMTDDDIRSRVALIRLHLEYTKAFERQKTTETTVGRGGASVIIDTTLESIHKDWATLDRKRKADLRAKFHDNKRYGKRWLLLSSGLGPSILLLCSQKVANMMLVISRLEMCIIAGLTRTDAIRRPGDPCWRLLSPG